MTHLSRRSANLALLLAAAPAWAQPPGYPSKPVKWLVGSAAGGPADYLTRLMGDALQADLGQPLVVENRPGASGTLAAQAVARAAPDGHTLLMTGPSAMVIAPFLMSRLGYDPARDFVPLALASAGAFLLAVNPDLPARSVQELVTLARLRPGAINYGSGGLGSSGHLAGAQLAQQAEAPLTHVPYKGDTPAVHDLVAGRIHCLFAAPNVLLPQVRAGRLRLLAVTSRERMAALPQVPTLIESGLRDLEILGWLISFAPAGTPPAVLQTLRAAFARARARPAVQSALAEMGMLAPAHLLQDDALEAFLATERQRMRSLVRDAGIQPE